MRSNDFGRVRVAVSYRSVDAILPDPQNARKHPARQLTHLRASIRQFGFRNPILVDERGQIIAGHARLEAAKAEGLRELPCIEVSDLSPANKMALAIADNRIAEHGRCQSKCTDP
jgi:ParB-like chromosome segregation protein Spo0J